jgi:glutamate formiminotransferase
MKRLIECVPNFSEGRDTAKVDAIVEAMSGVAGAWVLDRTSDADHNRSVITLAGEPEAVAEAVIRGAGKAAELIDMTRQQGAHPRIGATDVIPFVPLEGVSVEECVALARRAGQELWDRYRIPVYFYEAAATRPHRVNLENIRKGEFEGLREDALRDPDRSPDIGEPRLHSTAGATAVGVRKLLIAYNIHLNTSDISIAKKIARAVRFSSGGLRHVKAIGVELKSRGIAQISINLTDFEQTPLHRVFEMVKREAERHGCAVTGSEIVGLVPRKALEDLAEYYLQLENFSAARVLENRLAAVAGMLPEPPARPAEPGTALQTLLHALRAAVEELSIRALSASREGPPRSQIALGLEPQRAAESFLDQAAAAAQILQRLVQLEAIAPPHIMTDLQIVRQMALAAGRAALECAAAILPTLHDASMGVRLKARWAEIEAQLTGKPVGARNLSPRTRV